MNKGIREHKQGETYIGFLLVKSAKKGTTRNGKPYLAVSLGDSTGTIGAMVWDATEDVVVTFGEGNVVVIKGTVGEYNGKAQLNLEKYRKATNEDEYKLSDLLEAAPVGGDRLLELVSQEVEGIENDKLRKVTETLFKRYYSDFKVYPAARTNHHAYVSGLAYHTYSMIRIAKGISQLYQNVSKDLLIAGIVLHDLGKIKEYSGYISTDFTLEGRLKGHISLVSEEIKQVALDLDIDGEEVLMLQHVVLAHHGKTEWGSPVRPQIIEAEILHQIDMMDATLDAHRGAMEGVEDGEFTERIFSLDNRSFYKHTL